MTFVATAEAEKQKPPAWRRYLWLPACLVLLYWLLKQARLEDIRHAFAQLNVSTIVLIVFVLSPLAVLLRALRWRILRNDAKVAPLHTYIGAYLIGVLANLLLFGKAGDLVRAHWICHSRREFAGSLAVVVVDRLVEGTALVLLLVGVLLFFSPSIPVWAYKLVWVGGIGSVGGLLVILYLLARTPQCLRYLGRMVSWMGNARRSRILGEVEHLLENCRSLTKSSRVLGAMLLALATWCVEVAIIVVLFSALSIRSPWIVSGMVLLLALNLGNWITISPGAVGFYQILTAFALSFWGVERQTGIALGVVLQTILFVPLYLAGAIWLCVWMRRKGKQVASPVLAN